MGNVSLSAGRGHRDSWKGVRFSLMEHTKFLSYLFFTSCLSKEKPEGCQSDLRHHLAALNVGCKDTHQNVLLLV